MLLWCFFSDEKGLNFHLFSLRTESLELVSVLNDKRGGQVKMELLLTLRTSFLNSALSRYT